MPARKVSAHPFRRTVPFELQRHWWIDRHSHGYFDRWRIDTVVFGLLNGVPVVAPQRPVRGQGGQADGVIVEGNGFLEYVDADLAIMCARSEGGKIKASARKALAESDLLYLSSLDHSGDIAKREFEQCWRALTPPIDLSGVPMLTREDFPILLSRIYHWERIPKPLTALPQPILAITD